MKKKLIILLCLLEFFFTAYAQKIPFKLEIGCEQAYAPDNQLYQAGLGAYIHPSYLINKNIDLGIKIEIIELGKKNTQELVTHVSALFSYLATAKCYFSSNPIRPYLGVGAGGYNLKAVLVDEGENNSDFEFNYKPGFSPKIGLDIGPFTINIAYNWIYVTEAPKSKIDYFSASLGGFFGGKIKLPKRKRIISIDDDEDEF